MTTTKKSVRKKTASQKQPSKAVAEPRALTRDILSGLEQATAYIDGAADNVRITNYEFSDACPSRKNPDMNRR